MSQMLLVVAGVIPKEAVVMNDEEVVMEFEVLELLEMELVLTVW